jgi:hypothetical protein
MDRRTFIRVVGASLGAGPFAARTQTREATPDPDDARHSEPGEATTRTADQAYAATLPPVVFRKGLPQRIHLGTHLPRGERYNGGWFDTEPNYHSYDRNLVGVTFDAKTCELVYDGRDPDPHKVAQNPSREYWVGVERPRSDTHWHWPPSACRIPPYKAPAVAAQINPNKHSVAVYCPWNRHVYIFGGDGTTWGLLEGGSNGRAVMWDWDPIANTWKVGLNPPGGRSGDVIPLSPDIMGMAWDAENERLFITWGNSRPGFATAADWASHGYKATPYPANSNEPSAEAMPCFTYDPKEARPFTRLAGVGSPRPQNSFYQNLAYDPARKRMYLMDETKTLHWLVLGEQPLRWRSEQLDLGAYQHDAIHMTTHMVVDESGNRLLFLITGPQPALLAITLPEHRMVKVAELPVVDLSHAAMGLVAMTPMAWIPEHRSVVVFWEPLFHHVGPWTASMTVNIDTGTISAGPRFPNLDDEKRPWFPHQLVWYPPTQELLAFGFMWDDAGRENMTVPQTNYRYKWIDGPASPDPASPWTFVRIESVTIEG